MKPLEPENKLRQESLIKLKFGTIIKDSTLHWDIKPRTNSISNYKKRALLPNLLYCPSFCCNSTTLYSLLSILYSLLSILYSLFSTLYSLLSLLKSH
jgi:hypothetical protein